MSFHRPVNNIHIEELASQTSDIGPRFIFISRMGRFFIFFMVIILDFIKLKLGHVLRI